MLDQIQRTNSGRVDEEISINHHLLAVTTNRIPTWQKHSRTNYPDAEGPVTIDASNIASKSRLSL